MAAQLLFLQYLDVVLRKEVILQHLASQNRRRKLRRKALMHMLHDFLNSISAAFPERQLWSKMRSSAWWDEIVLRSWTSSDFKENFRMQRDTFDWLCEKLKPFLTKTYRSREPVSVEKQVALTLMKLGSAGELRIVAHLFGLGRSTVCIIVNRVCHVVCNNMTLQFPDATEICTIAAEFFNRGGLPGCCGALDGCHIPIKAPTINAKNYFCRKQFYSIVLQAVTDAHSKFMNVNIGWPGSVHDARVLCNSNLYRTGQAGDLLPALDMPGIGSMQPFIVADAAYPLLDWLMEPFSGQLSQQQIVFNNKLSSSRVKVEHAFGILKGRFRCLLKANDCKIKNIIQQTLCCCILHNICIEQNDECLESWVVEDNSDIVNVTVNSSNQSGCALRNSLLLFC